LRQIVAAIIAIAVFKTPTDKYLIIITI